MLDRHRDTLMRLRYETVAIIHHSGRAKSGNLDSGHYTAYIKIREAWVKCNDNTISPCDTSMVGNSSAYLVLCRRATPEVDDNNTYIRAPGGENEDAAGGEAAGGDSTW